MLHARKQGFTIVELLIVVVVIGVLAAIVVVAYNGITTNANRVSAASEVRQWVKLFELYRAQNGSLPSLANGGYCLGTGYPTGYCRDTNGVGIYSYAESTGAAIITALSSVGKPPQNSVKSVVEGRAGPYLTVSSSSFLVNTPIPATNDQECGKLGMTHQWLGSSSAVCHITIPR